jgi:polar amino acid transport system substrate-binding protein
VVSAIQYRRADCDFVLGVISRKDIEPAGGVRVSRPYHRSGVVLVARSDSSVTSLASLGSDQRVRGTGRLAGLRDAQQGWHHHLPVRI